MRFSLRSDAVACRPAVARFAPPARLALLSIWGLLVLAACAGDAAVGDGSWHGTIETLRSGAVLVRSPGRGTWRPGEGWKLRETLRIGSATDTGPSQLGDIWALAVDSAGRIYVAGGQAGEVKVFGPDGSFVRAIGREGRGPGELRWPAGLTLTPDGGRLLVVDYGNARWSVFDTSGALLYDHQRPLPKWTVPWSGGFDPAGRPVEPARYRPARAGAAPDVPGVLLALDSTFAPVDSFPFSRYGGEVDAPFSPRLEWRLDGRGHLWSGASDRYRVVERTLAGDTLRVIERSARAERIPGQAKEEAARSSEHRMRRMGMTGHVDRSRIPDDYPRFDDLWVDGRGDLWVVPYAHDWTATGVRELDVFGPGGRYLGRVRPPAALQRHFPVPVFRGEALYAVTEDHMGVEYVVRLRIEQGGGRATDGSDRGFASGGSD